MLSAYHVRNLSSLSIKHRNKIILPDPPSGSEYLSIILEAMDRRQKILLHKKTISYIATPYFLKAWDQRWYLIACIEKEKDATFISLDTLDGLELIHECYNEEPNYFYGQIENENNQTERIVVRYSSCLIDKITRFPFHSSQKSIGKDTFCYEVSLTEELYCNLLALGEHFEVLSPPYVRSEIGRIAKIINNKHQV